MEEFTQDEREAIALIAELPRGEDPDAAAGGSNHKCADQAVWGRMQNTVQPYPFFYYKDYSTKQDPDPLTPLTPPGRVPNFPAKMHAILAREDMSDIITWMPHGRSWKILKPRDFEVRVIPQYFEHVKFTSFVRQANGWGFRRFTIGRDRNSYYHAMFLRGMPHLCKGLKRPSGMNKKVPSNPDYEPDLWAINDLCPLPDQPVDEAILLKCVLEDGPKARVPVLSRSGPPSSLLSGNQACIGARVAQSQQALGTTQSSPSGTSKRVPTSSAMSLADLTAARAPNTLSGLTMPVMPNAPVPAPAAAGLQLPTNIAAAPSPATLATALQASSNATHQFAAGFAMAAALSQQQMQSVLGQMQMAPAPTASQANPPTFSLPEDFMALAKSGSTSVPVSILGQISSLRR